MQLKFQLQNLEFMLKILPRAQKPKYQQNCLVKMIINILSSIMIVGVRARIFIWSLNCVIPILDRWELFRNLKLNVYYEMYYRACNFYIKKSQLIWILSLKISYLKNPSTLTNQPILGYQDLKKYQMTRCEEETPGIRLLKLWII